MLNVVVPVCTCRWLGLEEQGVATGKFFVEPVILTINYAKMVLGYKRIVMMGLSGGGWTTTLAVRSCCIHFLRTEACDSDGRYVH